MADCADATRAGKGRGGAALAAPPALLEALGKTLDAWLVQALADDGLLQTLAKGLRPHLAKDTAAAVGVRGQHATAEDLAAVVEALLLLEGRVARLEESLRRGRGKDVGATNGAAPTRRRGSSAKAGKGRLKKGGAAR